MSSDVDSIQRAWARERPELPVESIGIVTRISRIATKLERHRAGVLTDLGLDASALDLLATIRRAGAPYRVTPTEIAERSLLTTGAISQRLRKAEKAGLVTRHETTGDRRSAQIGLSETGAALLEEAVTAVLESEQALVSALDETERRQLTNLLARLLDSLP